MRGTIALLLLCACATPCVCPEVKPKESDVIYVPDKSIDVKVRSLFAPVKQVRKKK